MFLTRGEEGKIKGLTGVGQAIITVLTIFALLFGGYMFLRGEMKAIAQNIEKETVTTFQMEQQVLRTEQKTSDLKHDMVRLENLRRELKYSETRHIILQKQLEKDPGSELLKQELEKNEEDTALIKDLITKLKMKVLE